MDELNIQVWTGTIYATSLMAVGYTLSRVIKYFQKSIFGDLHIFRAGSLPTIDQSPDHGLPMRKDQPPSSYSNTSNAQLNNNLQVLALWVVPDVQKIDWKYYFTWLRTVIGYREHRAIQNQLHHDCGVPCYAVSRTEGERPQMPTASHHDLLVLALVFQPLLRKGIRLLKLPSYSRNVRNSAQSQLTGIACSEYGQAQRRAKGIRQGRRTRTLHIASSSIIPLLSPSHCKLPETIYSPNPDMLLPASSTCIRVVHDEPIDTKIMFKDTQSSAPEIEHAEGTVLIHSSLQEASRLAIENSHEQVYPHLIPLPPSPDGDFPEEPVAGAPEEGPSEQPVAETPHEVSSGESPIADSDLLPSSPTHTEREPPLVVVDSAPVLTQSPQSSQQRPTPQVSTTSTHQISPMTLAQSQSNMVMEMSKFLAEYKDESNSLHKTIKPSRYKRKNGDRPVDNRTTTKDDA